MKIPGFIRYMALACACIVAIPGINRATGVTPSSSDFEEAGESARWADSVMASMSLRDRVAQLMVPRFDIAYNAAGQSQLRNVVAQQKVGGILLGKGKASDYAGLIDFAGSVAAVPLMVTLDGEWGPAMRVTDAPRFPYNICLGAIADDNLLYDYGREVARQCRELGIGVDFAPVLDVNSNPRNPVIGYRSFGEDPERVSRLGVAFSRGLADGGVMPVGKHFPGHGDTDTDSHHALPVLNRTAQQLEQTELVPFRDYIAAGMPGIMTGHLTVPALDPTGTPASLSPAITTGLLKKRMKFNGIVFTDALAMKGAKTSDEANNCVAALKAGADVLLQPRSLVSDIQAVVAAVKSGEISEKQVNNSCRKILVWKHRSGLVNSARPKVAGIASRLNSDAAKDMIERLAEASMVCVRNDGGLIPVGALSDRKIAVVTLGAAAENTFSVYCRKYARITAYGFTTGTIPAAKIAEINKSDLAIVLVTTSSSWAAAALKQIDTRSKVAVVLANPIKISGLSAALGSYGAVLVGGDDIKAMRKAAAQAVFGGIDVTGRMPVAVPGLAPLGAGSDIVCTRLGYASPQAVGLDPDLTRRIDSIARAGVASGAYPGCQVVVARRGRVVVDAAYGKLERGGADVTGETLYDVASMTKATATVAGLMKAYDEGLFRLDDPISQYIPELTDTEKSDLTPSQLLYHESGMPAIINVSKVMMDPASYTGPLTKGRQTAGYGIRIASRVYGNSSARMRRDITSLSATKDNPIEIASGIYGGTTLRDTIMSRIYQAPLRASKSFRYSCLNFCLLMEMEENVTGTDHARWVRSEIFGPLGAWHTGFRPREYYSLSKIAPTENDAFLRRQTVRGYVHDEIAAFSGGVQGNAGLFSTASDVAKYSQMLLNGGVYGGERLLSAATVRKFTDSRSQGGKRALGFDLMGNPLSKDDTAGYSIFGHTGFTGTCFWIDPENELIFVFLSNRVNPSRHNRAFTRLNPRGLMMKAIYESIKGAS